ncbi:hypothetical protein CYMTET_10372 [Cymbomonas tetramitiformis]|uniref:Uncharacterized protein n=1 Tax=Cymbomonas tetramitiformis TaxID=36881 RepID=A0AAE0GPJ7_9CHLO|nr:hypothetical protein CYMTET_10372 [Cymbomonas tetramitiformis]
MALLGITIDVGIERVTSLKRSQLIALVGSMDKALAHFRKPQIFPETSTDASPIILDIVVSSEPIVGGASTRDAASGFQQDYCIEFWSSLLGRKFYRNMYDEFSVGTVSFVEETVIENEEFPETEEEYTAEEWAAWEADAHNSFESGGALFYDKSSYYEEQSGYHSGDGYY